MLANALGGPAMPTLHAIIGVMPHGFQFPDAQMQFWTPVPWTPRSGGSLIARLADDVSMPAAAAELEALLREIKGEQRPATFALTRLAGFDRQAGQAGAARTDVGCELGPSDRLRERREPAAGTYVDAPARTGDPHRSRRRPRSPRASAPDRKRHAGAARRRRRRAPRGRWRAVAARAWRHAQSDGPRRPTDVPAPRRSRRGQRRARGCAGDGARDRPVIRARTGPVAVESSTHGCDPRRRHGGRVGSSVRRARGYAGCS